MSTKTITDLRQRLFDALDGLKSGSMDIEKAKAIAGVGQTIINSAKVEVDYMRATGTASGSGFIADAQPALPPGVKVHRIKG